MSRFGDLMKGRKPPASEPVAPVREAPAPGPSAPVREAPAPDEPVAKDVVEGGEEVVDETPDLSSMSKSELEEYGREIGVELDKRHSRKRLIGEIEEALDTL
jgi:hypothetical protein